MKKKSSTRSRKKPISTRDFDAKFDRGESIVEHLDVDQAIRRVNVDFPNWTVAALDRESRRLGVTRQALIKMWIAERLDALEGRRKKAG